MISAKNTQSHIVGSQIERVRRRLEAWRKSHEPKSRLPNQLWNSAARLASLYGLNKTAKALHLDYYDLKKRLDSVAVGHKPTPSFVELVPTSSPLPECLIELEARSGAKMRIHLKGVALPDLTTFGSMFWRTKR
jgi:hypothetical protein